MTRTASSARVEELADRGQLDRAARECEELAAARPDDERLVEQLARVHEDRARRAEERGRRDAAAVGWREAGAAWARADRLREAAGAWRAIVAMDPGDEAARRALAELARRRLWTALRDSGLAVLSALLILAASPPLDLWPLAVLATAPLFLAVRRAQPGRAALLGWLCGIVTNVAGNHWAVGLLGRFAGMSTPAAVLALAAVSAYQGAVLALWAGGLRALNRWLRLSPVVTGPLLMVVCEAAVPFIFPWHLAICAWRAWPLLQVAELGGPLAVSALLVLLAVVLAEAAVALRRRARPGRAVVVGGAVAVGLLLLGLGRAAHVASRRQAAPVLRVALVQPNAGILSREQRERHGLEYVQALRAATEEAGRAGADLVVWPESAFPFLVDRSLDREYAREHPWALRGDYGGRLLFGALVHPFGESYVYNSAVLISAAGEMAGVYDKTSLLVFGEYVPMRDRFPAWARRVRARLPDWPEIEPGAAPGVLIDGGLRIAPLICYEDILPTHVHRAFREARPNLLVTLANHAWFGDSVAPRQALALATLRSVETRRDLARATNTGVSSFGDALGRVLQEAPLHDVERGRPGSPLILQREVRLLDDFALGPYAAPVFPYAAGTALVLLSALAWRRRRR